MDVSTTGDNWTNPQDAPIGTLWFFKGQSKIGTWQPVVSGTIGLYYESALAVGVAPEDWYSAIVAYVRMQIFNRLLQMDLAREFERIWLQELAFLEANRERQVTSTGYSHGPEF